MNNPKAIEFYNLLISKYEEARTLEKNSKTNLRAAFYRDEQRRLAKIFEKTFHKPIDKSIEV